MKFCEFNFNWSNFSYSLFSFFYIYCILSRSLFESQEKGFSIARTKRNPRVPWTKSTVDSPTILIPLDSLNGRLALRCRTSCASPVRARKNKRERKRKFKWGKWKKSEFGELYYFLFNNWKIILWDSILKKIAQKRMGVTIVFKIRSDQKLV